MPSGCFECLQVAVLRGRPARPSWLVERLPMERSRSLLNPLTIAFSSLRHWDNGEQEQINFLKDRFVFLFFNVFKKEGNRIRMSNLLFCSRKSSRRFGCKQKSLQNTSSFFMIKPIWRDQCVRPEPFESVKVWKEFSFSKAVSQISTQIYHRWLFSSLHLLIRRERISRLFITSKSIRGLLILRS